MGVLLTNVQDSCFKRTSGLFTVPFTVCGWFRLNDLDDYYTFMEVCLSSADSDGYNVFLEAGGTSQIWASITGASVVNLGAVTAGSWVFLALTDNGTNAIIYRMTLGGTMTSQSVASPGGTIAKMHVGCRTFFGINAMEGTFSDVMVYSAALSADQLRAQASFARPVHASPHLWWPAWDHTDTADYSGNGRTASTAGTLAKGDQAPVTRDHGLVVPSPGSGAADPEGDLAITGSGGAAAMAGTSNVTGSAAITGSGGSPALSGTSNVTGEAAITGSGGTPALAGGPVASGDLAVTGSGGTPAMEGTPVVSGDEAITGSGGTPAMSGTSDVDGELAISGSGAAVAMEGETDPLATGPLDALGSGAAVAMAGTSTVHGEAAVTGSGGTPAMEGTSDVPGALAIEGSGGTPAIANTGTVGDAAITGSGGTPAMEGGPVASGSLGTTSSGGAAAMEGTSNIPGALAVTSSGGTPAIPGTTNIPGELAITGSGASVSIRESSTPESAEDEWHPDYWGGGSMWIPDYYGET